MRIAIALSLWIVALCAEPLDPWLRFTAWPGASRIGRWTMRVLNERPPHRSRAFLRQRRLDLESKYGEGDLCDRIDAGTTPWT